MNERIRELAKEAGLSHMPSNYPDIADLYKGADFELEKFAKLLIRECISTVEKLSPGYQDYRNQIEDAFRRDCVDQIKKHFGVEE